MYCGDDWDNTTTATTDVVWYEFTTYHAGDNFEIQSEVIPKWWKWYDIFRTWAEPALLPLMIGVINFFNRNQSPVDVKQRKKQKRRMFVQKLRAT